MSEHRHDDCVECMRRTVLEVQKKLEAAEEETAMRLADFELAQADGARLRARIDELERQNDALRGIAALTRVHERSCYCAMCSGRRAEEAQSALIGGISGGISGGGK